MSTAKTRMLHFRIDPETEEILDQNALENGYFFTSNKSKINRSKYLRNLIHGDKLKSISKETLDILVENLADMSRAGTNLNNINRYLGLRASGREDGFHEGVDARFEDIVQSYKDMAEHQKEILLIMRKIARKLKVG